MALLSVDAGTTGVTALIVGDDTRVLSRGYAEFAQHFPADAWVEHDPGQIWSAVLIAVREALAASPVQPQAIGITNQRETVCFWDRETLGSARRAIVWQDRRTADTCEALRESGVEPDVTACTGLRLDPYFSATKIDWVRRNDPVTWAGITSQRVAVGTVDSYLVARMTRGLQHITDPTNASRTLLMDLATGTWSAQMAELFGVPLTCLPEIVPSYGSLGRTDPSTFLGLDLPITGIAGDQQAALIGQGGVRAGDAKCTYGTGAFVLVATGEQLVQAPDGLLSTVALGHPGGRLTYALEGSVFVAGSAVQWLRDGLGIIGSADEVTALAETVPDSGGVVVVPALTGLGAPQWDPSARGLVIGITRGTTAGHIARATLDGIASQVRDVVEVIATRTPLTHLAVDGGAAASDLLCQRQADLLQCRVERSRELQATGVGAALLAGVGVGRWGSLDDLARILERDRVFLPGPPDEEATRQWRRAVERARHWAEG